MRVTVVGLGAMGGGMARSLLRSPAVDEVAGFDLSPALASSFHSDAAAAGKATPTLPSTLTLDRFVDGSTDVVLLVLVNEAQCEVTCFGGDANLISILREGSCVVVSSTVSAEWTKSAFDRFAARNVRFLDCPVSGGAVRALAGEITIMASGEPDSLEYADPLLRAMGKEVHVVRGGVGMGSTAKMVHQLLAGVHIVAAAEALALAERAGLDVDQVYDIVSVSAGSSWMFRDRGRRMIDPADGVRSALAIFVKDMDIVHRESRRLGCPTPLAAAALQQFVGGAGLGLAGEDDSSVVRVYETLAGVSVGRSRGKDGNDAEEEGDAKET